ncbi:MAG TPA: hypothetical protein VMZ91_00350 [Candidatus Paceibacterota bacterium]|nr:hypothetical protein [Candidatus Paceibacterota bacterium]
MLKAGDVIEIVDSMFLKILQKKQDCFSSFVSTFLKVGMKGILVPSRNSKDGGWMSIHWDNGKKTNCLMLDELGIEYEKPKFKEIPLEICPDQYLGEAELIRKHLRKKYDTPAEKYTADVWLDLIASIMNELNIVFYKP